MQRLIIVFGIALLTSALGRAATDPPRLIVILVVDQLRADYLQQYDRHWRSGMRTLLTHGRHFEQAEYPYSNTMTCAGHATVATGTLPRAHGMVLNAWWDREERRNVDCTADRDAPDITYGRAARLGHSAKRLLVPTLADELRAQRPGSRTVALSVKARSAIPLAGQAGDAVVWFDDQSGSFVTSKAFAPGPVSAVKAFIDRHPYEKDLGRAWTLLGPRESYLMPDAGIEERPPAPWTGLFPHVVTGRDGAADATFYNLWQTSPFADAYLGEMAAALVDALELGQRDTTDFLGISFSALDQIGHDFGPASREVEDTLRHLDVTLGALIERLDARIGRDRYVLSLTSDHGVPPIATPGVTARIVAEDIREHIEETLLTTFGPLEKGSYVDAVNQNSVVLAPGVFDRLQSAPAAMRVVERAVMAIPGVLRVLRGDRLDAHSADRAVRMAALGYRGGRSGDLLIVPKPGWYVTTRRAATGPNHGSMYEYDTRVPVILFGAGIAPGRSRERVSPADIAPTLARLAGIDMTKAEGRPLRHN